MLAEARGLGEVEDEVVRLVMSGGDLLQDHVALALELLLIQFRRGEDVGENVQRQRPVLLEDAGIVCGGFHAGGGVDLAAGGFDFLRDGARRTARRALEGHVLEEVGDAIFLRPLVAGAGLHPDAQRRRLEMRHVMGDDMDAVVEAGDFDTHLRTLLQACCCDRMKSRTRPTSFGNTVNRSLALSK